MSQKSDLKAVMGLAERAANVSFIDARGDAGATWKEYWASDGR
jgi:hypothetical protein